MRIGHPNHCHERQVPKEDESLGTPRPPAKLLQVISPPAPGAHQGQAAQLDAIELVVDHHVRGGASDRRDHRHIGPVAGQVIIDQPERNSRVKLAPHDHFHV